MNIQKFTTFKTILIALVFTISANQLFAQTTNGIFFQAVARDNYSNPAKDRKIYVQSSIIQTTPTGIKVLTEEHQANTDASGVFSISLGNGVRVGGTATNLTSIDWSKGPFYLNLKVAITPFASNNGWDYTKEWVDMGTTSFGAVPFALYSASSAKVDDKLNITDTTKMLAVYAKAMSVKALETSLATKLTAADTLTMLAPYAKAAFTIDSNFFRSQLATKLSLADSTQYVTPTQLAAKTFDQTPITNAIATKLNIADTISLSNRIVLNNTSITANTADIVSNTTAITANTATITAEITRATNAETALSGRILSNTASITANTSNIALKANTTDVNTALALKANSADLATLTTTVNTNTSSITANTADLATLTTTVNSNTASITANTSNIALKANTNDVNTALALKANSADVTSLTATVNANTASITATAADLTTLTTTVNTNTASITANTTNIALKAPLESPTFTGTPNLPTGTTGVTQAPGNNSTKLATTAFVASAVNTLSGNSVPYTGATGAVNLGNYDLSVNGLTIGKGRGAASLNTAIGGYSLNSNSTGNSNTAIGYLSLYTNSLGANNTASGVSALQSNTTGSNNTANGINSLKANSEGENNTSIGSFSLERNSTGSNNIAIGYYSLNYNTTAGSNTAIGNQSLSNNSTGEQNTANGYKSLRLNTGSYNTANGTYSLESTTTGAYNTALGYSAGRVIADGYASNSTSDYSVYLGSNTKASADDAQNEIVIGYNAIGGGSNTVTLGNTSVTNVKTSGALTVGAGSSSISGGLIVGAATSSVTSAVLEASSTTKGFLPPRMSGSQRDAISSKVAGLVVWCSSCGNNGELQVYNGTTWTNIIGGTASPAFEVGMAYQGGIIAYILQSGDPGYDANVKHGLIAATSDQNPGIIWGPYSTTGATGATGTAIGTGSTNTDAIILSQGNSYSYAAKLCADYSVTLNSVVYDDWYLPSKDELRLVFNAKSSIGGFSGYGDYWSSSEKSSTSAFVQEFYGSGSTAYTGKDARFRVRAIRSF